MPRRSHPTRCRNRGDAPRSRRCPSPTIAKAVGGNSCSRVLKLRTLVRVGRHVHMHQPARLMFDHHKDVELAKARGDDEEEVARNDRRIAQEGRPTLIAARQTRWVPRHVLSDSPWRNPQPKFQEQFVGNALFAPGQILGCQAPNQLAQFQWIGGRPTRDLTRHNNRKPARCQRSSVSGRTTTSAARQSNGRGSKVSLMRAAASMRCGVTLPSRYNAS